MGDFRIFIESVDDRGSTLHLRNEGMEDITVSMKEWTVEALLFTVFVRLRYDGGAGWTRQ